MESFVRPYHMEHLQVPDKELFEVKGKVAALVGRCRLTPGFRS